MMPRAVSPARASACAAGLSLARLALRLSRVIVVDRMTVISTTPIRTKTSPAVPGAVLGVSAKQPTARCCCVPCRKPRTLHRGNPGQAATGEVYPLLVIMPADPSARSRSWALSPIAVIQTATLCGVSIQLGVVEPVAGLAGCYSSSGGEAGIAADSPGG